jgi:hypothetical protein
MEQGGGIHQAIHKSAVLRKASEKYSNPNSSEQIHSK